MKKVFVLLAVVVCASAWAASSAKATFEKVPAAAKKALGGQVGKPITKGVVFLNGHVFDFANSYQVARVGTAIYLRQKKGNKKIDTQITQPVKPWSAFLETQPEGVVTAVSDEPEPAKPEEKAEPEPKPEAKPKPKPEAKKPSKPKSSDEDAEDFFEDEDEEDSSEKSEASAQAAEPSSAVAEAEESVEKPAAKEEEPDEKPAAKAKKTLKLTGTFVKNAAVERLLKPVDDLRKRIDVGIRNGHVYFFSARYGMRSLEPRLGKELLKVLPSQMKDAKNGADLYRRLRSKNILFVSEETCQELMANRVDYLLLDQIRLRQKSEAETNKLIYGGN